MGEDAHWAGGVSLEFLRFLARRIGDLRVLFVVTYRDDEIGPTHPLRRLLGDLATAQTVHRLNVPPLSEADRVALPHQILRWIRSDDYPFAILDANEHSPLKSWLENPATLPLLRV